MVRPGRSPRGLRRWDQGTHGQDRTGIDLLGTHEVGEVGEGGENRMLLIAGQGRETLAQGGLERTRSPLQQGPPLGGEAELDATAVLGITLAPNAAALDQAVDDADDGGGAELDATGQGPEGGVAVFSQIGEEEKLGGGHPVGLLDAMGIQVDGADDPAQPGQDLAGEILIRGWGGRRWRIP